MEPTRSPTWASMPPPPPHRPRAPHDPLTGPRSSPRRSPRALRRRGRGGHPGRLSGAGAPPSPARARRRYPSSTTPRSTRPTLPARDRSSPGCMPRPAPRDGSGRMSGPPTSTPASTHGWRRGAAPDDPPRDAAIHASVCPELCLHKSSPHSTRSAGSISDSATLPPPRASPVPSALATRRSVAWARGAAVAAVVVLARRDRPPLPLPCSAVRAT